MCGKRDFADVIKLRSLRWGDCPARSNYIGEQENASWLWSEGDATIEEWSERCNVIDVVDGERVHKPRNMGSLWKIEKARR